MDPILALLVRVVLEAVVKIAVGVVCVGGLVVLLIAAFMPLRYLGSDEDDDSDPTGDNLW